MRGEKREGEGFVVKVKFLLRKIQVVDKLKEIVYNKSYRVDEDLGLSRRIKSAINGIMRETEVCKHYAENISA